MHLQNRGLIMSLCCLICSLVLSVGMQLPLASRPSLSGPENTFDSPAGHFKVHWTDSGEDSTAYDYAFSIALAADSSWQVQCGEMGFFQPPPDNGAGGDDLCDIYVLSTSAGVPGYTSCYGEYHPPDSTHDCSASYMVISNSISEADERNCSVAHQFQHAVQYSYDYGEPTWFMENCAVWMTEMVYPDADCYLGFISTEPNALRTPWRNICFYGCGGFPWPWMMSDRWGTESVRSVWEYCAEYSGNNLMYAHSEMLADHGMTFNEFFMDYGCWRWFTASNWFSGCGMYSEEVSQWLPGPRVLPDHEVTSLPFIGDQTDEHMPDQYGIHWIRVDLSGYQDHWVEMLFDGRDNMDWNLGVILQDLSGRFYFHWYECDPTTGDKTVAVDAQGWDYAVFIPACMDNNSQDHMYDFIINNSVGIGGAGQYPYGLELTVSSNPMGPESTVILRMPEGGKASLSVYDMSGRVTAILFEGHMNAGEHYLQIRSEELAAGTYFLVLSSHGASTGRKVVISP
ncbi:MAG: T9SS type A sorting domain-containing protein [Candidatus Aegiribacteria sp.]|nr:T9SS type A sorting domain-containing protein [Candidatus Aegiribacteria sp.]MBD3294892.1 T9SS type A sorting domain-containing protein [Candidatus Fermentibacteria bacterium]